MLFLSPLPPGGPAGGSGLSFSFRNRGSGPDVGRGDFNFDFDLKYSRAISMRFYQVFNSV